MAKNIYLVTGAAGFIGAAVASALLARGHDVVTVDNLTTGFKDSVPRGVTFIYGNCQDAQLIEKLAQYPFAGILHIAGQSSGEISFDDPLYDLQTNTQSTLLLLKLAQKVGCRKFVYASSMSIYGDQPDAPVTEQAAAVPKSFYAVGKLASENYMRIFQQFGIRSTALRLYNVYGPGQNMKNLRQGMVSIYLAQAVDTKRVVVKGSTNRFRDFIYIDDIVGAFLAALDSASDGFRVYNVGTGVRTTVKQLLAVIQESLPFPVLVESAGSTLGDQFGIYSDSSLIARDLGFTPRTTLSDGIKKMVAWALRASES